MFGSLCDSPIGLRFSGSNMSPLYVRYDSNYGILSLLPINLGLHPCGGRPGWLAGAQSVALNMSNVDLPVQCHFAWFEGSAGYVLKPPEMRGKSLMDEAGRRSSASASRNSSAEVSPRASRWDVVKRPRVSHVLDDDSRDTLESEPQSPCDYSSLRTTSPVRTVRQDASAESSEAVAEEDDYWPPPCEKLHCTTLRIFSLHNLPKVMNAARSIQTKVCRSQPTLAN